MTRQGLLYTTVSYFLVHLPLKLSGFELIVLFNALLRDFVNTSGYYRAGKAAVREDAGYGGVEERV